MNKLILYFVLVFLFASCERYEEVNIKLPFKSKLVSVSFIKEGSNQFQVSLTRTTPVFDRLYLDEPNYVSNALVTLQTPGNSYVLTYNETNHTYEVSMPSESFEAEKVYGLIVEEGGETITGTTSIPGSATPIASAELDSFFENGTYSYLAKITGSIKEPGTYNVKLSAIMVYEDSSSMPMIPYSTNTLPVTVLKNGQQTTQTFLSSFSSEFVRPVRVDVVVILCDEPYTRYNNSINNMDWYSSDIPIGEPSITYGNMSNQIGVIGAYRHLPPYSVHLK